MEEAVLRTLAPGLRHLETGLRAWLEAAHRYPLHVITRATLEGLATDLRRKADDLDVDRPLLVIILMGGTGVGKSTLLNALAGDQAIAQASFARPTTRDPVVYYHESIRTDRLNPALRHCRLVPHDRPSLVQKVIVDTPDLDSNDLANRDKLMGVLPVADVVLYVGSQEKYHDKLGWDLFVQQRKRRAFAFVLNKWDRCVQAGASGVRPDEDLERDLRAEGFAQPLIFRTCAQLWVDHRLAQGDPSANGRPAELPEGEQFEELVSWLELGLNRLEIEAIKARGVTQMLEALDRALTDAAPPDLTEQAYRTQAAWSKMLREEAAGVADVLLQTLDPYQKEIEHHFALQGQQRFTSIMAGYLTLFHKLKYVGSTLRDRIPMLPSVTPAEGKAVTPTTWDLAHFTRACSEVAATRSLDARARALASKLLVAADGEGFPLNVLTEPVEATSRRDWRQRNAQALIESLDEVHREASSPEGGKRVLQASVVMLANWAPLLALFGGTVHWLYMVFMIDGYQTTWNDLLRIGIVLGATLGICHILIALVLPLRWPAIRNEFRRRVEDKLRDDLKGVYNPIPVSVSEELAGERRRLGKLQGEVREVATWLASREQAASVVGLYGG